MSLVFVDTETVGLEMHHDIFEIAYAFDDEPVQSSLVSHSPIAAEEEALVVNHYYEREVANIPVHTGIAFEAAFMERLGAEKPTLVGANPSFDAYRLCHRWGLSQGAAPWHYRLIDVETYAIPVLDLGLPVGLNTLARRLSDSGFVVPEPNHTARGDVETVRAVYLALSTLAEQHRVDPLFGSAT